MLTSGYVLVPGGHTLYYEVHGAKHGRPAVELHGGPGGGLHRGALKQYNLKKWKVVLFDQRGCGKSTPFGKLENNTTWDLVNDIEILRIMLGFDSWFVSGGSWGTTLGMVYAEAYPSHVSGLLLRAMCLCNRRSNAWLYEEGGVSSVFPKEWSEFAAVLPPQIRHSGWKTIARYYQKKLSGSDAQKFANAWWGLERRISRLIPPTVNSMTDKETLAIAKIENHFFVHDCWLKEDHILKGLRVLKDIPITIVHGRYDMICPITGAAAIKQILPHTNLVIIPDAGHSSLEPSIGRALRRATDDAVRKGTRTHSQRHSQRHSQKHQRRHQRRHTVRAYRPMM